MKHKLSAVLIIVAALLVGASLSPQIARAIPSYFTIGSYAVWTPPGGTNPGANVLVSTSTTSLWGKFATTTQSFMTPGTATTTYTVIPNSPGTSNNASDVDDDYLFVQFSASTSAATLNWKEQFSNDGVDWYDEDFAITPTAGNPNGNILHASSTIIHSWQPGSITATTSLKAIQLPRISSIQKRVIFSIPSGSTNGAIWVMNTAKRNASGQ